MMKKISFLRSSLPVFTSGSNLAQSTSIESRQTEALQSISGDDQTVLTRKAQRERDRALRNMRASSSAASQTSENQSECANINHPQWDAISPSLRKYVQARMQKALAQERHFGKEHLERQGGICRGLGAVWLRLHQAKPDAAASNRMDLLMSESGTAHATVAQRLYAGENVYSDTKNAPSLRSLLDSGREAQFDAEIANLSSMYATQATNVREKFFSGKKGYTEVGKLLNKSPGYYDMGFVLENKNGEITVYAAHDLSVFSEGHPHPLTIFDSNLGEFRVPEKELPRFMKEMFHFYKATRGYEITGIRSVLKIEFTDDISNTPLAQLAAELH